MPVITKFNNFDASAVTFSDVKTNNFGGKSVYLNYNGEPLRLQGPRMRVPYDMSDNSAYDTDGGNKKYSVNFSFQGMDREHDPAATARTRTRARRLRQFHDTLQALSEKVIEAAAANSGAWLGQPHADETVIKVLFNPLIRQSKDQTGTPDGKYPDTIRAKVGFWEGRFTTELYDDPVGEPLDVEETLKKGADITPLIDVGGLWFTGGKLGVVLRLKQAHVWSCPTEVASGFALMPESDSDDEGGDSDEGEESSDDE